MKNERAPSKTLEETAADAIRLGREVALLARTLRPGSDAREVEFLDRCLAPLRNGQVFDLRHEGGFEAALGRLRVLRDSEELGRHREFVGFHDPEGDSVGLVQEVVEYSDRGRALSTLVDRLEAFLDTRQDVLDRLEAERLLLGRT
ncbi:hypothetical protein SAMN05444722_0422 [Rhodovulum sp. ES.010]|uniref:hypothetical protein n=1 Tax=Rhodovulum sp. ES.010 TaxID=1882821 RepID=UPI00092847CB|nr:hypothetical protein [Rhodovulum sp. ES.010]SIO10184.1 hypothetical protein SAMN05444722_0422 [Rhodovulum sp. ES.010]